jgi:hypothetical protein
MSRRARRGPPIVTAHVLLGWLMAVAATAAQAVPPYKVAAKGGDVRPFSALVQEVAEADVVLVAGRPPAEAAAFEGALLTAVAERRPAIGVVLGNLEGSAQDALEHFLMGHMTFQELASETRMAPALVPAVRPVLDLALARSWPVRAGRSADGGADRGRVLADAIASAYGLGRPTRTLVVAVFDALDTDALGRLLEDLRTREPGARVRAIVVVPATSAPAAPAAPGPADYIVYAPTR